MNDGMKCVRSSLFARGHPLTHSRRPLCGQFRAKGENSSNVYNQNDATIGTLAGKW